MIEINNLTREKIEKRFLLKVAGRILKKEKRDLSVALIGERRMRELNRKYRGKNQATDVLSFNQKEIGLGEIILCPGQIRKNSRKLKIPFSKELAKVLIHGILHLLGYDHERSEKEAGLMEKKENHYLKLFFK